MLRHFSLACFFIAAIAALAVCRQKQPSKPAKLLPAVVQKIDKAKQVLTVHQPVVVTKLVSVSRAIVDKKGKTRTVTEYVPVQVKEIRTVQVALKQSKVYQLNGRRMAVESALKRLSKGSKVLIAPTPMITAAERKKLGPDGLIVVPPKPSIRKKVIKS